MRMSRRSALGAAIAACVVAPAPAGAAVVAGPAGDDAQVIVAKVSKDRRAVSRLVFVYVARCSDGQFVVGWTGFGERLPLRDGRLALEAVKTEGRTVTIRARRTPTGLTGTVKVVIEHTNGSVCRSATERFTATPYYAGGTTSQGYPFAVRLSSTRRSVQQLVLWSESDCGEGRSSWSPFSGGPFKVGGGAFSGRSSQGVAEPGKGPVGTETREVHGRVTASGVSGTYTATVTRSDPASTCSTGTLTYKTWRP